MPGTRIIPARRDGDHISKPAARTCLRITAVSASTSRPSKPLRDTPHASQLTVQSRPLGPPEFYEKPTRGKPSNAKIHAHTAHRKNDSVDVRF